MCLSVKQHLAYGGFLSRSIKLCGLLEYVYAGLREKAYVLMVKAYFWHLSEYWVKSCIYFGEFS